jgi:precorrin-2/cobalt-factor-2 C20-methyltransferase
MSARDPVTLGKLYVVGVGPGNPQWLTVQATQVLAACRHVGAPRSRAEGESVALEIARPYLRADAVIHELTFPMTSDTHVLEEHWRQAACEVREVLAGGEDCAFLTLGDPLLYATSIFLVRALRELCPEAAVVTVPGVTAFSAAAALTGFAIGEGKEPVTIVPAADDMAPLCDALDRGGTVVLMKVGRRLERVLDELERRGLLERAVFVAHAGMPQQRVETDLRRLRGQSQDVPYLSIVLIHAK